MIIPYSKQLKLNCLCVLMTTLVACQSNTSVEVESEEAAARASSEEAISPLNTTQNAVRVPIVKPKIDPNPPLNDLWDRIRSGFQLQEFYFHADVTEQLENYIDNQAYFDLTIERARPFLFIIVSELEARGLPQELALLPFVESGFNPAAGSSENAVGIWQFMSATAASFGLQHDWWYDARRDPHDSTIAALDYLQELYLQFDQDWLLALAAYNAGDGNVRRAVRRNKTETGESPFWELNLPRETRLHVPRVLAMARLVSDSGQYGIALAPIANAEPLVQVEVGGQIDFAQAAQLANMDYAELRSFNPGYLQWATHPDQPQHIKLPPVQALLLESALAQLTPDQLLTWDHYLIESGDSLASIAKRYQTRVDVLQKVNNLRGTQIIAGKSLLIPRNPDALGNFPAPNLATTATTPSIPSSYRIRSGDNLWSIARRFDLRSADIALWNGMDQDAILRPGQILNLVPDGRSASSSPEQKSQAASSYIVRSGDSMASIAARFNTNLKTLLEQNNLDAAALIHPGQVIQISQ